MVRRYVPPLPSSFFLRVGGRCGCLAHANHSSVLSSRFSRRMTCFLTTSTLLVSSKSALMISPFVGSSPSAGSSGWMLVTPVAICWQAARIWAMAVGRSISKTLRARERGASLEAMGIRMRQKKL